MVRGSSGVKKQQGKKKNYNRKNLSHTWKQRRPKGEEFSFRRREARKEKKKLGIIANTGPSPTESARTEEKLKKRS